MIKSIFIIIYFLFFESYAQAEILLRVDLTDIHRNLIHIVEQIPAKPGPMTLAYPKWIPSQHAVGPIEQQVGLVITANGKPIPWTRNATDLYLLNLNVPEDASMIEVRDDFITTESGKSDGGSASSNAAVLEWENLLFYPYAGTATKVSEIFVTPSVTLPSGWRQASALSLYDQNKIDTENIVFRKISLDQLIDSPLIAGRYFREIAIAPDIKPAHFVDIVADKPEDLEISALHLEQLAEVVRESGKLFKGRHYGAYRFLFTVSDRISGKAMDHHQSMDKRLPAGFLTNEKMLERNASIIPHDFVHSWNGNYKRPEGIVSPNFQEALDNSALWITEGLTDYLASLLTVRSAIWSRSEYLDILAEELAAVMHRGGRHWRNLDDNSKMAAILWEKGEGSYDNWRRNGFDFFAEGALVWLDVDVTIRNLTAGKRSLNDFAALFYGGTNHGPEVKAYSLKQLTAALNEIAPNDWDTFFAIRLHTLNDKTLQESFSSAGYRLVFQDRPNPWTSKIGLNDFDYSLAMKIDKNGVIKDVQLDGIAAEAGFFPGQKIATVNGSTFGVAVLLQAIREAAGSGPSINITMTSQEKFILNYHGGERYPILERIPNSPDRLSEIAQDR